MSKGRKIGHINIVGATREEARQRLAAIEAAGEQSLRWVECRARGAMHSVVRVVMVSLSPLLHAGQPLHATNSVPSLPSTSTCLPGAQPR